MVCLSDRMVVESKIDTKSMSWLREEACGLKGMLKLLGPWTFSWFAWFMIRILLTCKYNTIHDLERRFEYLRLKNPNTYSRHIDRAGDAIYDHEGGM